MSSHPIAIVFGLDRSICNNKQLLSQRETGHVPHTGTLSHYAINQWHQKARPHTSLSLERMARLNPHDLFFIFVFFCNLDIAIMVHSYQERKITIMFTMLASIKRSVYYKYILQFCHLSLETLDFLKKKMDSDWLSVFLAFISCKKVILKGIPTLSFICAVIVTVLMWTLLHCGILFPS